MKKLLLLFTLLFSMVGFSQALVDGTYTSTIYNADLTKSYDYTFNVKDGIVDIEGLDTSNLAKKTLSNNATTTMTWINAGGVWTENQTYIFTKDLTSGKMYLYFIRVVQNEGQIPWSVAMAGYVYKTK